jgi:hypothetical protein
MKRKRQQGASGFCFYPSPKVASIDRWIHDGAGERLVRMKGRSRRREQQSSYFYEEAKRHCPAQ